MTTYQVISLLLHFSVSMTAGLTLIITIVVFLNKKK
ncbi:putative holin-like toxin [Oceanobacillus picturae]|nr:putative holin-like toxin [Oceanobacillus picturae]